MEINLFDPPLSPCDNILPSDGIVNYYGKIFTSVESTEMYTSLYSNIERKHDEAIIFGRHIITKRKVARYADESIEYNYSNTTKKALLWTDELVRLKNLVEKITNEKYNSCLLNLYHDGQEGMAWHSDDEKEMKKEGCIASLSIKGRKEDFY